MEKVTVTISQSQMKNEKQKKKRERERWNFQWNLPYKWTQKRALAWRVDSQHAKIIIIIRYIRSHKLSQNKIEFVVFPSLLLPGSDFGSLWLCPLVLQIETNIFTNIRLYLFITSIFLGFLYAGHLQWCLRIWLSGNVHWCLWVSQM